MKTHNYLNKFLCLTLSSVLLISNTQVFAQYADIPTYKDVPDLIEPSLQKSLIRKMKNVNELADDINASLTGLRVNSQMGKEGVLTEAGKKNVLERVQNDLTKLEQSYADLSSEVNVITKKINKGVWEKMGNAPGVNVENGVLETLAHRYYGSGAVIERDMYVIEKASLPEIEQLKVAVTEILSNSKMDDAILKNADIMSIWTEQLQMEIKFGLESRVNYISKQNKSFFEAMRNVSEFVDREKIWNMAFSHLTPQQQASVKLVLQASKESKSAINLAKDINRYLAQFKGTVNPSWWNTLKLSRQLRNLTPEARVKYVDEITKLKPTEMHLAQSITERPAVARKFLKIGAPIMIVGIVLTAVSITEVNAQNAFPEFASIREKKAVRDAIENDEEVSMVSLLRWYTDPSNQSIIEKDNAHFINLIGILFSVAQAEEDKEGILSIMNEMDNDSSIDMDYLFEKYAPKKDQVEKDFESAFDKYNKQKKSSNKK